MTRGTLDRTKLAGVLGMLGSDAHGERAAAGLLASRMLRAAGVTWSDLLAGPVHQPQPQPQHRPHGGGQVGAHFAAITTCQRFHALLTVWERSFLAGIATRRTLTDRQLEVLLRIADELPDRRRA